MKFVNKLSVISLVVLMFSFMNVAHADKPQDQCKGSGRICDDINKTNLTDDKKAIACNNSYEGATDGTSTSGPYVSSTQCKWTETTEFNRKKSLFIKTWSCKASGGSCLIY